jgi:hypothetical protein
MFDYQVIYPGQVSVDAAYPQGKAKNVSVAGDGTGTPWEEQLVNDILGFHQALIKAAGITVSGSAETADVSDLFNAAQILANIGRHDVVLAATINSDARFDAYADFAIPYTQNDVTSSGELDFALVLPRIGTLKLDEVHAVVCGSNSGGVGHSALPATLPHLYLERRALTLGGVPAANVLIFDQVDTSAVVADYNKVHLISSTGLAHTIGDNAYQLGFTGETGADSENGKLLLLGIYFVLTP